MSNIIKLRRGNFADLPAAGTRAGEPRFCLDTGQLFIDDGAANKEITPTAAILDHKGDAAAHHAKYTHSEARAVHSPISIHPAAFVPRYDTQDWKIQTDYLMNRVVVGLQRFYAPVVFPDGVAVTKLTLFGYRDIATADMLLSLLRNNREGVENSMASVTADWIDGYGSKYDNTIANALISTSSYGYCLYLTLDPDSTPDEIKLTGVEITFS